MDGRNVLIGALAVGLAGAGWYALHPETSLRPAEYQKSSEPITPTGIANATPSFAARTT